MSCPGQTIIRIVFIAACVTCLSCRKQPAKEAVPVDGGTSQPSSTDFPHTTVPITCAAPRVCLHADVCRENDGTVIDSLECDIHGVCCDLNLGTDTLTDPAGLAPSCGPPYGCTRSEICAGKGGAQIEALTCADPAEICCDLRKAPTDTQTGGAESGGCPSGRYYVTPEGNESNTGQSWDDAVFPLQAAIEMAHRDGCDVWVEAGTYLPTEKFGGDYAQRRAFILREGVALFGGFAGTEADVGERQIEQNRSVLSGDIGDPGVLEDNAYHVVIGANGALLDGFVVQEGYNSDTCQGGGMLNEDLTMEIRNAVFYNNWAWNDGSCNTGGQGGAMYNRDAALTITNTLFLNNFADVPIDQLAPPHGGGAMYNQDCTLAIAGSAFIGNGHSAGPNTWNGGGAILSYQSNTVIAATLFSGNHSEGQGGALFDALSTTAINMTYFLDNYAYAYGGAIYATDTRMHVQNALFSGNSAGHEVEGDAFTGGGASLLVEVDPAVEIIHCTFVDNLETGGYNVWGPTIIRSSILFENSAPETHLAGEILYSLVQAGPSGDSNLDADPLFRGFPLCAGQGWAGQQFDETTFETTLTTAAPCWDEDISGMILVTNDASEDSNAPRRSFLIEESKTDTLVVRGQVPALSQDADYEIRDYRLSASSPCIDSADDAAAPNADLAGNPRVDVPDAGLDGVTADMGAYEYQPGE